MNHSDRITNAREAQKILKDMQQHGFLPRETYNNIENCIGAIQGLISSVYYLKDKNQELQTWCDELISENRRLKEDKLTPFKHDILNDLSETLCDSIQRIIDNYKE